MARKFLKEFVSLSIITGGASVYAVTTTRVGSWTTDLTLTFGSEKPDQEDAANLTTGIGTVYRI